MIGEETYQPYKINTFSRNGKEFTAVTPAHYVHPHNVSSYTRRDGTFVSGYWRDGDGNTKVNRNTGYWAKNPDAVPQIIKKKGWLF